MGIFYVYSQPNKHAKLLHTGAKDSEIIFILQRLPKTFYRTTVTCYVLISASQNFAEICVKYQSEKEWNIEIILYWNDFME